MNPISDKTSQPFPFLYVPPDASPNQAWIEPVRKLFGCSLYEVERELILETLRRFRGNRTASANVLKISIRTMRNKIREYEQCGITVQAPVPSNSTAIHVITNGITQQHLSL